MLVRAVAYESKCLLFACSASTLTSKWLGEGEKLVKTLFRVAVDVAPSIIFLDELDALLSNRKSDGNEHEASRRFKTEFMIQMDGIRSNNSNNTNSNTNSKSKLVLVVGCTNCPWDVDAAVLRRFPKRLYIPLPDEETRRGLIQQLLQRAGPHTLTSNRDVTWLVKRTAGFSGSDLTALASEASFGPLRALSVQAIRDTPAHQIRPITKQDFEQALLVATKSVPPQLLNKYQEWEQQQQS
jgi:SpoVK/Ycf46/Vps4 family AAA+-type ATPase